MTCLTVEKPPLATASLFELSKRKNVNEIFLKNFPEFALWVIRETIHVVSHQLSSAATVKTDDTLNTHVFSFILKLCVAFTGNFCVQNNENYMVFSSDIL